MNITKGQRNRLVLLLKTLQVHLESAVESSIVASTGKPMPGDPLAHHVKSDRRMIREAQGWIEYLKDLS